MTTGPRIKYANSLDGVRIAFWEIGEGPPLVLMPGEPLWQIQLIWQVPAWRTWLQQLARGRQVIVFDGRATGLSDGNAEDLNLQSQRVDLVAVVDHLSLDRFDLFAPLAAGPAGITYAVAHPRRLQHLILWCSYANGADYMESGAIRGLVALMSTDWDLFLEMVARARFGPEEESSPAHAAELLKGFLNPQTTGAFFSGIAHVDVTPLLPRVQAPTLVLSRHQTHIGPGVESARSLAAGVPNARLTLLDGISVAPYLGDAQAVLEEVNSFLGTNRGMDRLSVTAPAAGFPIPQAQAPGESLSPREVEVLRLVAQGMSNQEVADVLFISVGTVKSHLYKIFGKLDVRRRTQASTRAKELGLI